MIPQISKIKNVSLSAAISGKPLSKWICGARSVRINIGISSSWEKWWEPNGNFCSTVLLMPVLIHLVPSSSSALGSITCGLQHSSQGPICSAIQPKLSLGKAAKDLSYLKGNHCCGWPGCSEDPWTRHEKKSNTKHELPIVKGKLDQGQPRGRRQLEDMESKCAGSKEQTFPGAMPNAPVMSKILNWFEMLGFATLLPKQTLSGLLFSSPPSWVTWAVPRLCL